MAKTNDPKIELSELLETEFKRYTENKVYISNFATGGGKSYNIAKLTCTYYPKHFEQVVILCVQKKLIRNMKNELDKFLGEPDSLVKKEDVLIVESNADVLKNALASQSLYSLYEELKDYVGENCSHSKQRILNELRANIKNAEYRLLSKDKEESQDNLSESNDFSELESKIRKGICGLIGNSGHIIAKKELIIKKLPSISKVYPQVNLKKAKVILLTVQKALMGIDLILEKSISLTGFNNSNGTLFIFDESDQAALSMRNVIIRQSLKEDIDLYRNYVFYQSLMEESSISENFEQKTLLLKNMAKVQKTLRRRFEKKLGISRIPNNILLSKKENLETLRNGVFLCGPFIKYGFSNDDFNLYNVIAPKGANHLTMHRIDTGHKCKTRGMVYTDFIKNLNKGIRSMKAGLINVVKQIKKDQLEYYNEEVKKKTDNWTPYPTDENSVHTLLRRFRNVEESTHRQLIDFLKTPRNIETSKGVSVEDSSVYMQGLHLYHESVDEQDLLRSVSIYGHEIQTTPEKIIMQLVKKDKNAVVLSSATADNESIVSNFSIQHLRYMLRGKMDWIEESQHQKFENLLGQLYPINHRIKTKKIVGFKFETSLVDKWELPNEYSQMFCKEARKEGLDKRWFVITKGILKREFENKNDKYGDKGMVNNVMFQINRLFKFIVVYHKFWHEKDIHSMIYFQNRSGQECNNRRQIMLLSSLIDGSFQNAGINFDSTELPDIENENVLISNDTKMVKERIQNTIRKDPHAKLMLVTAYNSFKAGENLQYEYPKGLNVLKGNNWSEKNMKDWDSVYLEEPTHHFTIVRDNMFRAEEQTYMSLLNLMMFYEDGKLSRKETFAYLDAIIKNKQIYFRSNKNPAMEKDKAKWMLTILEQAVGRLCRTKDKNQKTYIFYDEGITLYFQQYDKKKSYTKEFRQLIDDIEKDMGGIDQLWGKSDEVERVNFARKAKMELDRINTKALKYNRSENIEVDDEYEDDDIEEDYDSDEDSPIYKPHFKGETYQHIIDDFKQVILKYPTLKSTDDIADENIGINILQCYGAWKDPEREGYDYWKNTEGEICVKEDGKSLLTMDTNNVRLDVMMKNSIIKNFFEKNGYATSWNKDNKYILHPDIMESWYAGEIGEQAFLALLEDLGVELKKLKGNDYELADFVLQDRRGKNVIAFDVKNYDPNIVHADNTNDMPIYQKRKHKRERLGCRVITVNILKVDGMQNTTNEIGGLIDQRGNIITENLEIVKTLIKNHNNEK